MITNLKSNISFKKLPFKDFGSAKVAAKYTVPVKNDADVFVRTYPNYDNNEFVTSIDDKNFSNIAKNRFDINRITNSLDNGRMDVFHKKNRGKGFGIVLHLNNVMALMENNLDRINLNALSEAVLFHAKFKFQPDLRDIEDIQDALYKISVQNSKKFPELKGIIEEANEYSDKIYFTAGACCCYKKNVEKANDIVNRYLEVLSSKKLTREDKERFGFNKGFKMFLTKEKILENKDFFNGLFKKFDIDYKI